MKRYHLTPAQQEAIGQDITDFGRQILAINFDDPTIDEKVIRHHAHLKGKFLFCQRLLEDEFPEPDKTGEDDPQPVNQQI